ncbi:MAG: hypothetical protein ACRD1H_00405 [Vicinamibacterales bacterium]
MKILLTLAALSLGPGQTPPPAPTPQQSLTAKREVLRSVVAITTLPAADLASIPAAKEIEHDSEVARSEAVTVVVTIQGCQAGSSGACNASADVVAYKPDGSVHSEMKNVSLTSGRGTTTLTLAPTDATGVYKVIATVRDLNARRFGKTERLFGVK